MKIKNSHERIVAAPPERIAALIADFDRVWPTQIAPAPRLHGHRLYDAGPMLGEEFDRPGAAHASRHSDRAHIAVRRSRTTRLIQKARTPRYVLPRPPRAHARKPSRSAAICAPKCGVPPRVRQRLSGRPELHEYS